MRANPRKKYQKVFQTVNPAPFELIWAGLAVLSYYLVVGKLQMMRFEHFFFLVEFHPQAFFMLINTLIYTLQIRYLLKLEYDLNIILGRTYCQIFEWKPFLLNRHFDIVTHFIVLLTMFLTAFQAVKTGPKAKVINTDECSTVHYIC